VLDVAKHFRYGLATMSSYSRAAHASGPFKRIYICSQLISMSPQELAGCASATPSLKGVWLTMEEASLHPQTEFLEAHPSGLELKIALRGFACHGTHLVPHLFSGFLKGGRICFSKVNKRSDQHQLHGHSSSLHLNIEYQARQALFIRCSCSTLLNISCESVPVVLF
jgi:hypothetical protein